MSSAPLPFTLLAVVTAGFFGGGGLWFYNPAHREDLKLRLGEAKAKIMAFEDKLGQKFHKSQHKLMEMLHIHDKDGNGQLSIDELVENAQHLDDGEEDDDLSWWDRIGWKLTLFIGIDFVLGFFGYVFLWKPHVKYEHDHVTGSGKLHLTILRAHNLDQKDTGVRGDVTDAYCVAKVAKTQFKTNVVKDCLNPKFEEKEMTFHVNFDHKNKKNPNFEEELHIEVYDYDNLFKSESCGSLVCDIRDFAQYAGQKITHRQTLKNGGKGELEFTAKYVPDPIQKAKTH